MATKTNKISTQKAVALAKKAGTTVKDMAAGEEIEVSGGILLKEAGVYYFTEIKAKKAKRSKRVEAEIEFDTAAATVEDSPVVPVDSQEHVEIEATAEPQSPVLELPSVFPLVEYRPRKVEFGEEWPLFKGGTRRRRSNLWRRIMRDKRRGRTLSDRDRGLLAANAAACNKLAEVRREFRQ